MRLYSFLAGVAFALPYAQGVAGLAAPGELSQAGQLVLAAAASGSEAPVAVLVELSRAEESLASGQGARFAVSSKKLRGLRAHTAAAGSVEVNEAFNVESAAPADAVFSSLSEAVAPPAPPSAAAYDDFDDERDDEDEAEEKEEKEKAKKQEEDTDKKPHKPASDAASGAPPAAAAPPKKKTSGARFVQEAIVSAPAPKAAAPPATAAPEEDEDDDDEDEEDTDKKPHKPASDAASGAPPAAAAPPKKKTSGARFVQEAIMPAPAPKPAGPPAARSHKKKAPVAGVPKKGVPAPAVHAAVARGRQASAAGASGAQHTAAHPQKKNKQKTKLLFLEMEEQASLEATGSAEAAADAAATAEGAPGDAVGKMLKSVTAPDAPGATSTLSNLIIRPTMTDMEVCTGCMLLLAQVMEHTNDKSSPEDISFALKSACNPMDLPSVLEETCEQLIDLDTAVVQQLQQKDILLGGVKRDVTGSCMNLGLCYAGIHEEPKAPVQQQIGGINTLKNTVGNGLANLGGMVGDLQGGVGNVAKLAGGLGGGLGKLFG